MTKRGNTRTKGASEITGFTKKILTLGIVAALPATVLLSSAVGNQVTDKNIAKPAAVKCFARFQELPITAITPEGWLHRFLENQREGLTGHLEVAGHPYNTCGWACEKVVHKGGSPLVALRTDRLLD